MYNRRVKEEPKKTKRSSTPPTTPTVSAPPDRCNHQYAFVDSNLTLCVGCYTYLGPQSESTTSMLHHLVATQKQKRKRLDAPSLTFFATSSGPSNPGSPRRPTFEVEEEKECVVVRRSRRESPQSPRKASGESPQKNPPSPRRIFDSKNITSPQKKPKSPKNTTTGDKAVSFSPTDFLHTILTQINQKDVKHRVRSAFVSLPPTISTDILIYADFEKWQNVENNCTGRRSKKTQDNVEEDCIVHYLQKMGPSNRSKIHCVLFITLLAVHEELCHKAQGIAGDCLSPALTSPLVQLSAFLFSISKINLSRFVLHAKGLVYTP